MTRQPQTRRGDNEAMAAARTITKAGLHRGRQHHRTPIPATRFHATAPSSVLIRSQAAFAPNLRRTPSPARGLGDCGSAR